MTLEHQLVKPLIISQHYATVKSMKSHYTLLKLSDDCRHVGTDWTLDSGGTVCRNKLTSDTITFGANNRCPWCIELGVDLVQLKGAGITAPHPLEPGRYAIVVCSPSFIDDPCGTMYFGHGDVEPLIMNTLNYDAVSNFVQEKLKEYVFIFTPEHPYGDEAAFHNATKHWLCDVDWNDYH